MLRFILMTLATCALVACASPSAVPDAARAELAPSGKLRAGMNLGNALFTTKDAATRQLQGVSVDLMRELAARLGVELELVVYASPGQVADAAESGAWDVAILAIEPARAQKIHFSHPITDIEATYLVPEDSALRSAAQVDAPGIRIATPEKAGYELYLSRTLRHATLVRTKGPAASIDLFNRREVDALAGLRPALLESMPTTPHARLLEGNFMIVNHGLCTPRGRTAGAKYLDAFAEEMKASGFIARSIERHRVAGLVAAKAQ